VTSNTRKGFTSAATADRAGQARRANNQQENSKWRSDE
jgi:hypothetical protein